ncbi:hypothetical protein H5410_048694 [Solanum commersonii]|uniref:Uncharacterized protein n=1 Tax=Solanum commersonii TaxID=4109 RepID=A0A9J5XLT3_SOLCO|nr:hypothetical protein H5410_048694 [Solanum commersonii]
MKVAEMRMLKWMGRHTTRDMNRNEDLRRGQGKEARLRWFGHEQRRCVDAPIKRRGSYPIP